MATIIAGTIAAGAAGVFLRTSLRQAARNGKVLSPIQQLIAGTSGGSGASTASDMTGNWMIGGFQGKMDKKEAGQILGLK